MGVKTNKDKLSVVIEIKDGAVTLISANSTDIDVTILDHDNAMYNDRFEWDIVPDYINIETQERLDATIMEFTDKYKKFNDVEDTCCG